MLFDYRNFGGSGGQPRKVLSVPRQCADYSTVIGSAVEQPYIDPRQITRLRVWSRADLHSRPGPGDLSIGVSPDGPFGEKLMTPKDGTRWHDGVATPSLLSFSWRRPVRRTGGHYDVYDGGAGFADVL